MKLRGVLPKQELNGLNAIHGDAVSHVGKSYLVVALVKVVESTQHEDKSREAKVQVERIEVGGQESQGYLAEILEGTFEERTGKTPLDLDIPGVEDLRKRFRPGKGTAKPEASLLPEPAALTAAPVPVDVDPATLTPEEQAELDGVIDAEVEESEPGDFAGTEGDDPEWTSGYPEGQQNSGDEDEEAPSTQAPQFSG